MSLAIDTNIFIYAHHADYPEHKAAYRYLKKLIASRELFFISWQVYYEYIRIVTHPRVHKMPLSVKQAAQDMDGYLQHPACRILQETSLHREIFLETIRALPGASGNFIHDCHFAALLKENGIREIVTADMDFKKFDFLKVINPIIE